jgi:tetratricopeptide (TPR) repeat protein/tRNA A-37 threonylcarbamoyl transferase component Bud32
MIGKLISHYRIIEKIGRGGMGEVYLAVDTRLERRVALKFLPQELTSDADARQRFEREAKAVAALSHPNIVTIHEIGEHEGQVFMAMEYAAGRTLRELIQVAHQRGEPLPLAMVMRIAAQIAAGLSAAHARGIVHRDIKPQNIIVGDDQAVKILDFGLAKLAGISTLTKGSMVLGTMHYISPEQARGKEADRRSDLWALGVVLYEMLSGRLPFAGESPQAILYSVIKAAPQSLADVRPGLPASLLACVKRLLAKDPASRYQDSGELISDLAAIGPLPDEDGTEILHAGGGAPTRRGRLAGIVGFGRGPGGRRRPRLAAALLALGGIALLYLLSPATRGLLRRGLGISVVPRSRHLAVLPFSAAGGADGAPLADGFMAVVAEKLTLLEKYHDTLWTVSAVESLAERDKPSLVLQRLWGCNLFLAGELYEEDKSLRLRLKLLDARQGSELGRVELQGHMGNLSVFQDGLLAKLCALLNLRADKEAVREINAGGTAMPGAYILFLKGRGLAQSTAGRERIDQGIALLEKALQQDNGYIQARLALANALRSRFRLERDPRIMQRALEQGELAKREAGPWAPALLTWALLLSENGERASAGEVLQEVLRLNERCYTACIELARLNTAMGRINEAEGLYRRAIAIRAGNPRALAHLGYFYKQNGRTEEALALYQQVTALAPGDFNALNNMGNIYLLKNDKAGAMATFERSIAIQPNAVAQSNLATLLFYEGDYRKALPLFKEVAANGADCRLWGNLADTYRQLPEYRDKAAAAYRRAIDMASGELKKSPDRFELLSVLDLYQAHLGEKAQALAAVHRARALAPADLETIRLAILTYEAAGERSLALGALREFRERLGSSEEIEKEPDLAEMRRDPEYAKIVAKPK